MVLLLLVSIISITLADGQYNSPAAWLVAGCTQGRP